MVAEGEIRELLSERPDLEPALEAVLEPTAPWDFDDVDVDSGAFGELVSRGIVEQRGDHYHVPDRAAIQAALATEPVEEHDPESAASGARFRALLSRFDPLAVGLLGLALASVVVFRLFSLPSVFRGDAVVLLANDPYYYRILVEEMLSAQNAGLSTVTSPTGEPLYVATLWAVSELAGGTASHAGTVMAWYPVVTAVLTAGLVYATAVILTDDRRIGLAAVLVLAILPGHAFRTALGFADHHAFDYVWLTLTVFGFVTADRRRWASTATVSRSLVLTVASLAIGVAGQALAWDGSPILLAPAGLVVVGWTLWAVSEGGSPLAHLWPVATGIGLAALLVGGVHGLLGWQSLLVVLAVVLLALGTLGTLLLGEAAYRFEQSVRRLAVVQAVSFVLAASSFAVLRPEDWTRLVTSVQSRLLTPREIAEVSSILGNSLNWLFLFGLVLVAAIPYLGWGLLRARSQPRWLAPTLYAWYLLFLSVIQQRFAGELSLQLAIFAGLGVVHIGSWIDACRAPAVFSADGRPPLTIPDTRTLGILCGVFLIVGGIAMLQVPVKTSQVTVSEDAYETARWMAAYSDTHQLVETSVFSNWGTNRMFNYFVSGTSGRYGYAQSNYLEFIRATDGKDWYDRLASRSGFIVTDASAVGHPAALGTRLHRHQGSATERTQGLNHYRLLYVAPGGEYKVFTTITGAYLQSHPTSRTTVTVSTNVSVPGSTFTYTRDVPTDEDGIARVRVPYPGTYSIGNRTLRVNETEVRTGATRSVT
jgi:dolichyl-diphosphooligosaccharide--protein glycosyltransferase